MMKKTLLLLCLVVSTLISYAEATKKVAILEVVDKEGMLSYSQKVLLRSTMARAIANREGYEAYDRTDVDAIMSEHEFQRSGLVSESEIRTLGEMTGVSLILVTEGVLVGNDKLFVCAKIINIETEKVEMMDNITVGLNSEEIRTGCETLVKRMIGVSASSIAREEAMRKKSNTNAIIASAFIPGTGQMLKGHYTEGALTLVGEVALLGAGVGTYFGAKQQTKIMNSYGIDYATYQAAQKAKPIYQGVSYTCFGLAVVLYGVNLWRAYTLEPKQRNYAFYPTIIPVENTTNSNYALGLGATIKF